MALSVVFVEKADGFVFDQDDKAITCSRVFIGADNFSEGIETTDLPEIGDPLFGDTSNVPESISDLAMILGIDSSSGNEGNGRPFLVCRKRNVVFLKSGDAADASKIEVTCYYSNEIIDVSQFDSAGQTGVTQINQDKIPVSWDYTGEFQLFNPVLNQVGEGKSTWIFINDDATEQSILEPIPFRVRTITLNIEHIINYTDYVTYNGLIKDCLMKVNDKEMKDKTSLLQGGKGCWLFVSAKSEPYANYLDDKTFKFNLVFQYRDPDGTGFMGWQKIMRRNGKWDIPFRSGETDPDKQNIYMQTDLQKLFNGTYPDDNAGGGGMEA